MFILTITYTADLERIDQFLQEHIDYLDEQYRLGNFILSGPKVPRTGGVILSVVKERAQLSELIKLDPFFREGLAKFEIVQVTPTKFAPGLENLINNLPGNQAFLSLPEKP